MYDLLIRNSLEPARVRAAFDKLLTTDAPFHTVDENLLRKMVRVAEVSRFAIDIMRAHDQAWDILDVEDYCPPAELRDAAAVRKHLALSLFNVIVADVFETRPFVELLQMLSDTADQCIAAGYKIALGELRPLYGLPCEEHENAPDTRGQSQAVEPRSNHGAGQARLGHSGFAVFGLGKLGGGELNFSSDIDLIFVFGGDGETSGGSRDPLSNVEWYTRLAERLVEILSSRLIAPVAYRVDLRLRPDGDTGPLVRSLESTIRYYEREGLTWERQALLKARCIPGAGDCEMGAELLRRLEPFVFRRYLDRDSIYQIEAIKARIEAQATMHGRRHVKLSPGGIREIEFIVQLLQLANGGRCPEVRVTSTLGALDALARQHYIFEEDRDSLSEKYIFLRRLEHRIQIMDARQTHLLPESADEMDDLGGRMGFPDQGAGPSRGESLWKKYIDTVTGVRTFYERRFARSKEVSLTAVEEKVMSILDENQDPMDRHIAGAAQAQAAAEFGLDERSVAEMRTMSRGSIADPQTSHIRKFFIRSASVWLPILASLPDPPTGLARLSRMVERYGAKASLYEIFSSYPAVSDLIVNIASLSSPLSDMISRDPSTLEALLSPGGVTGERSRETLTARLAAFLKAAPSAFPSRAKLVIKSEENLRIGVRFLMGLADARQTGREFSTLAELLLAETSDSEELPNFAVVALGRFGGRDMGMMSDLDLVFVSRTDSPECLRLVQSKMEEWKRLGLKIDLRLRPMGRTSPMVCSIDFLASYFEKSAETWERIAWTRARLVNVISAPPDLQTDLEALIQGFIFGRPFEETQVAEMRAMRQRLLIQASGGADLKRGQGGMIDVEILAAVRRIRTHQIHASKNDENDIAIVLADQPLVTEAYRYLRTVDAAAGIVLGRPYGADLPKNDRARIDHLLRRQSFSLDELSARRRTIAEAAL